LKKENLEFQTGDEMESQVKNASMLTKKYKIQTLKKQQKSKIFLQKYFSGIRPRSRSTSRPSPSWRPNPHRRSSSGDRKAPK
jgi:hypothetical protein